MVYNLKQLRLMPSANFFKTDNGAQIFEVTTDRYYNGHDLSAAFCYLKSEFSDGTVDKFLLGTDFDENTVTVMTTVSSRMQRVEGVAKYQLSFESSAFTVQSDIFEVTVNNSIGDVTESDTSVSALVNEIREEIQSDLEDLGDAIDALENATVGVTANAVEKPVVITQKVMRADGVGVQISAIDFDSSGGVNVDSSDFTVGGKVVPVAASLTYSQLCALKAGGGLKAGGFYRITDYACTVGVNDVSVANHQFDIIVKATGVNTLSETAYAAKHAGDTYFSDSDLAAWDVKYCLENDTSRFEWADAESGKGVIYYLKDEWGNECPYDFKNIMFGRTYENDTYYAYTFSSFDGESLSDVVSGTASIVDASVMSEALTYSYVVKSNVIKEYISDDSGCVRKLNDIVILEDYADSCYGNKFDVNCHGVTAMRDFCLNVFGADCHDMTFGEECKQNTFGSGCSGFVFADDCHDNSFGSYCRNNTFGQTFEYNEFGKDCFGNTFGDDCCNNRFGGYFANNTAGDNFSYNSIGNSVYSNAFGNEFLSNRIGNNVHSNTIGNCCYNNVFGNECIGNDFGNPSTSFDLDNFCSNVVGNDVKYVACADNADKIAYLVISDGVSGTSASVKLDIYESELVGKNYSHYVSRTEDGKTVIQWNYEVSDVKCLYKTNVTDSVWTAAKSLRKAMEDMTKEVEFAWTAGVAENLKKRENAYIGAKYCFRTVGNTESVGSGTATIKKIKGNSVVWNQLVDTDTESVTTLSGHKYFKRINGVESVITSTGAAITVNDATEDNVFDLTLMFGSGKEPTKAEFKKLFPLEYYAYNAGTVINFNGTGIKTVGFNAFNVATGTAALIGGNEYQITGAYTALSYTDLNGQAETITPDANGLFTPSANGTLTVTGGNATDTCVHLTWSGYMNGAFESHWQKTLTLPDLTAIKDANDVTLFPDGLCSVGSVYDEITSLGAVKRIGKRAYASGDENDSTVVTDKTNTYYVLTTPVSVTFSSPYDFNYKVDDFGTEKLLPVNSVTPSTSALNCDVLYAMNAVDTIRNLPVNYISKESFDNFCASLVTAMASVGYAMTVTASYDASNNEYDYSVSITQST